MNSIGPTTRADIDNYKSRTWRLHDQEAAFSSMAFLPLVVSVGELINPVISPLGYDDRTLKNGHLFKGADITNGLLNQSLEYFQKSLYNFCGHYLLAKNGFKSWASVTNYYSSYFSVHALLALQGRAITNIKLNGVSKIACLVHPYNFISHEYIVTTSENSRYSHERPWRKYYDIYNSYTAPRPQFEVICSLGYVAEPMDESEERNRINYEPFYGYTEVLNFGEMSTFRDEYLEDISNPKLADGYEVILDTLKSLSTDADFKYFARSAMRLLLIYDLFKKVGAVNNNFLIELNTRLPIWRTKLFALYTDPLNYFEEFPTLLNMN